MVDVEDRDASVWQNLSAYDGGISGWRLLWDRWCPIPSLRCARRPRPAGATRAGDAPRLECGERRLVCARAALAGWRCCAQAGAALAGSGVRSVIAEVLRNA